MNAFPKERRFFIHKNLHRIIFIVFLHHIIQESRRSLKNEIDPVVQLVRMPPCHGGGRGFESRPDRKISHIGRFFCFGIFRLHIVFRNAEYLLQRLHNRCRETVVLSFELAA